MRSGFIGQFGVGVGRPLVRSYQALSRSRASIHTHVRPKQRFARGLAMAVTGSVAGNNPVFAQTMIRARDPVVTKLFYTEKMGMKCIAQLDFEELKFSLYFFAYTDDELAAGTMSRADTAQWLWSRQYPTLEVTHNWGTEEQKDFKYHNGNTEPKGFGHIGIIVEDVQMATTALETAEVPVVRKAGPFQNVGSLSFVSDPDGYWIELIDRTTKSKSGLPSVGLLGQDPVFAQTMIRVKDPRPSIAFYEQLGLQLVNRLDFPDLKFSLYFMAYTGETPIPNSESQEQRAKWLWDRRFPTLELTHNHGTENDEDLRYESGNKEPNRGFGHIGCLVDSVYDVCGALEKSGVNILRQPSPFQDVGEIAFVEDPDGYYIELITRSGEAASAPYSKAL